MGFEPFRRYLLGLDDGAPKDAEWAAAITGVGADTIRDLARRAAATRSMITCAWSLQRAHHGEQPYWAAIVLAAMLGGIGLPGGGFAFGHGSTNGIGVPRVDVPAPELPLPLNPARTVIPVARHADMLLDPGERYAFNGRHYTYPDIKLIYWAGGNPFHHHQDLNRLQRAWQKPQTIVRARELVDADRAPRRHRAARHHHARAQRRRRLVARPLHPRHASRHRSGARGEERLRHLPRARRSGLATRPPSPRAATRWNGASGSTTRCARPPPPRVCRCPASSSSGRKVSSSCRRRERDFVLFEDFRRDPERHPLKTPSGRIEIVSEAVAGFDYADCPPHPTWIPPAEWLGSASAERWPMHLVTHQPANRLHSQMDPGPVSRGQKVAGREPVRDQSRGRGAARHP